MNVIKIYHIYDDNNSQILNHYRMSAHLAERLFRTFCFLFLCAMWLENRVEYMEFSGRLKTKDNITFIQLMKVCSMCD